MARQEQQEAEKLGLLRKAWQDGIDSGDSGDSGEVDASALKKEARARKAASET
jgi:antitoxin ParD1/3/4